MSWSDSTGNPGPARRKVTVLESVDEIRAQVRASATVRESFVPAGQENAPQAGAVRHTQPYRPMNRPNMGLLCVLDDGDDSGELLRIRQSSFVIGRVDGNLVIPHDVGISGRHAELSRRVENGVSTWHLRDLQSTNGTFVRASSVVLYHDQEILICNHQFRMEYADVGPTTTEQPNATRKWDALSRDSISKSAQAFLVEISQGHPIRRHALTAQEYWIGRDPQQCAIVVDDPMIDPRHARLSRDAKNRWVIANNRSLNGVWARIQDVALGRGGYFQCGEQRFFFNVL